ncbi:3-hydroxyacyl-CoA dehydrogenase NAD-binding domain-containing protein [Enemella evansiae]|uniref:L-gulonate 3-dehydrogenase n=1 Tax=Enemella evansiae TaxID=2016499 RepID=A0A255GEK8_9ACTN|nr:3-hydroxyacyl-CoA dehydrogenase NAD-binding domain-containing protein [Enemella evansiae]OYO01350.1 3-hydroxybutyryl-CoA dehydrogenase [Enemella evansiae]OYO07401.1 3-hydroxybutyryl-CoA dehydrogenase [Enemella evansiae]OYO14307.1 3-hydroxybutyryl-CoA dehydrogenase [Enemella evansiae]
MSGPIVCVGAGRMGRGIALAYALAGESVVVLDFKRRDAPAYEELKADNEAEIAATLADLVALAHLDEPAAATSARRIRFAPLADADELLAGAAIVYEGVPETRPAKLDALTRIGELVADRVLIASTTSTMLATELAPLVPRPERFLNAHWLNPAYLIPLVELSVHPGTAEWARDRLRDSLTGIGKVPVVLGASPGFIVPRLQALVMNEAARMAAEGVASPAEIDRATRYGLGFRFAALGVLEFIDFGGNDILYHANRYLAEQVDRDRYALPPVIEEHMRTGRNGLRDGRGFYEYDPGQRAAYRRDVLARTLAMLKNFPD